MSKHLIAPSILTADFLHLEKEIEIRSVRGTKVGAVFRDTKGFDPVLGKYILP